MRGIWLPLLLGLLLVACKSSTPSQGGLGEDCYPNYSCDFGLDCEDWVCVEIEEDSSTDTSVDEGADTNYGDVVLSCTIDGDCDDSNPCTVEFCDADGYCEFEDLDADSDGYAASEVGGVSCGGTDCNDDDETVGIQECATVDPCCDGCTRNECWYDEATGYVWEEHPVNEDILYANAELYCSRLDKSGFGEGEWRIPTISELRTLIRGCPSTETGGMCAISDTCTSPSTCDPDWPNDCWDVCEDLLGPAENGCYWEPFFEDLVPVGYEWTACGEYYSSTENTDHTDAILSVNFIDADVTGTATYIRAKVRCIHTDE